MIACAGASCPAMGAGSTREEALKNWNRAQTPPPPPVIVNGFVVFDLRGDYEPGQIEAAVKESLLDSQRKTP